MFPILPILILLLLGPTNVERLAVEGRLPAALLAVHLAHTAPVRATVVAPAEDEAGAPASEPSRWVPAHSTTPPRVVRAQALLDLACPPRAGPCVS